MKLVVGLGNPGPRYRDSRHNVGFRIVEHLARAQGVEIAQQRFLGLCGEGFVPRGLDERLDREADAPAEPLVFLQPTTFMNRSGGAVAAALEALPDIDPAADLLVVYDDLDLPLGRIRLRPDGGPGGHNGLTDVIEQLETRDFARLRFGIGRPDGCEPVIDFVLDAFEHDERRILDERVPTAAEAAIVCLRDGPTVAMDRFNADPAPAEEPGE